MHTLIRCKMKTKPFPLLETILGMKSREAPQMLCTFKYEFFAQDLIRARVLSRPKNIFSNSLNQTEEMNGLHFLPFALVSIN